MLYIVTVATHSERYFPVLESQINDNNLQLIKLGEGKKYYGHEMKDKELIKLLDGEYENYKINDKDILVFLDAFDTIAVGDLEKLEEKFLESDKKMILSIENVGFYKFIHSSIFSKVRGNFINTGLYMGEAKFLREFLKTMYTYKSDKKSNQKTWSSFLYANAWKHFAMDDIGLDKEKEFFFNYSFTVKDTYKIENKKLITDKKNPFFIQGNGCSNMNDIIKEIGYEDKNVNGDRIFKDSLNYTYKAMFKTYAPVLNLYVYLIVLVLIIMMLLIYVYVYKKL